MKKILKHIFMNGLVMGLLVSGIEGFHMLALGILWVSSVLSYVFCSDTLCMEVIKDLTPEKRKSVPLPLSVVTSAAFTLTLAYMGYSTLALVGLFSWVGILNMKKNLALFEEGQEETDD